jgi:hypothetical protein
VQVTENLAAVFAQALSFSVVSVQSATFTVNPGFNGNGNNNLLAAGNTLPIGGSGTITLTLRVRSAIPGPYTNQVTATGQSPATVTVTDLSEDGTNPDPDDDGQSGDNNTPTPFTLPVNVVLIPTLNEWGLLALALLLGTLGLLALRRRSAKA